MSTKEAEFISEWNGLLDFKIDENNLRHPNFQFFYGALESLLCSLNFNIESSKNEAMQNDPDAERLYFIKFCGFVHRLYKLSDKKFNFFYLDLINPSKISFKTSIFFISNKAITHFFTSNRSQKVFPCIKNAVQLCQVLRNGEAKCMQ